MFPANGWNSSITAGKLGGIQRVDVKMFSWQFKSEQLREITKNCMAVAVVISSVDPEKVSDFTIRSLVEDQFGDLEVDTQRSILKSILDAKNGKET